MDKKINNINESPSTTLISYQGEVEVRYQINGNNKFIKTHNAGLSGLFTFLTRCLAGIESESYRPLYLDGQIRDSSGNYKSILTQKVPISTQPALYNDNTLVTQGTGDSNITLLVFTIPFGIIDSRNANNEGIRRLVLYSKNGTKACAQVDLSSPIPLNITSNAVVYWKLKLISSSDSSQTYTF